MKIIADTNVYLAVILNESEKQSIINHTKNAELVSSKVLPYEIGNALSAMYKRKRLSKEQILISFENFNNVEYYLETVDMVNALNIACAFNIYAYDAYYLELAIRLKLPLLTLDNKMKEVAQALNITLLNI
ncbi:MAG: type II toxin-antitoxin system VapC family toxin [Paludibacter sp.]|nr:type II toxin-antitoxin system VapC family toxin [Paludibacter sp.]